MSAVFSVLEYMGSIYRWEDVRIRALSPCALQLTLHRKQVQERNTNQTEH